MLILKALSLGPLHGYGIIQIYAPQEGAFFKGTLPREFLKPYPGLPANLRYFEGKQPERVVAGAPWEKANFEIVTNTRERVPGLYALTTQSQKPGTLEVNEPSLARYSHTERARCCGRMLAPGRREDTDKGALRSGRSRRGDHAAVICQSN
jgi:hypothetical protein